MGRRLSDTAETRGVDPAGRGLISKGYALAMGPRRTGIEDDHDPRYLHPGRCAVILMDDLGVIDPVSIAAGTLVESESARLRVPRTRITEVMGREVSRLVGAVPDPTDRDLAERLVTAERGVRVLALAERLDQLRHAHLWADMERRRRAHDQASAVYLPIAERTDPTLERRFRWWCSMFENRHLGGDAT